MVLLAAIVGRLRVSLSGLPDSQNQSLPALDWLWMTIQ
jgi:hypothetical protein